MKNRMGIFLLSLLLLSLLSCTGTGVQPDSTRGAATAHNDAALINIEHRDSQKNTTLSDNYTRLGAGYLAQENYEKALLKLNKAIRLDNKNAKAYNYLGILYWRLDKADLADRNFRISERLSPLNAAFNHNYAAFLCDQKRYNEAQKFFDRVFANPLYDQLSQVYQLSADCDLRNRQYDLAVKKFKKALKLDSKNSLALLGMAKYYYMKKRFKVAQYYFERFERISQHFPESLWLGINLQRKLGDKNRLSSYVLTLKNLYPDARETLLYIEGKQEF